MITRELLEKALIDAADELAGEQHRDVVFAAPLAVRVMAQVKALLGPKEIIHLAEQVGTTESKLRLSGAVFGHALYPSASPEQARDFTFRHFLEAFPKIVQVFKGPSGDMVRLLKRPVRDPGEVTQKYRELLLETLGDLLQKNAVDTIPSNQLGIWMKKRNPAFNVAHLGYSSLTDWLRAIPEIEITDIDSIPRVGLVEGAEAGRNIRRDNREIVPAYLLVDSSDLHSALYDVVGSKPTQAQLPEWAKVIQYCRDRWPAFDWRGRYLVALAPAEHQSMQGFFTYLQYEGFKVVKLNLHDIGVTGEQTRQFRAKTTLEGLERVIQLIRDSGRFGVLLVVSHSATLADTLDALVSTKNEEQECGVLGFSEKMPQRIMDLKRRGLQLIDLEKDCRAFKKPLNRSIGLNPEDIHAEEIL